MESVPPSSIGSCCMAIDIKRTPHLLIIPPRFHHFPAEVVLRNVGACSQFFGTQILGLRSPDSQLFWGEIPQRSTMVCGKYISWAEHSTVRENPTFSELERFADGKIPRKKTEWQQWQNCQGLQYSNQQKILRLDSSVCLNLTHHLQTRGYTPAFNGENSGQLH